MASERFLKMLRVTTLKTFLRKQAEQFLWYFVTMNNKMIILKMCRYREAGDGVHLKSFKFEGS